MICIICRLDKNDMSLEHVLPQSLGGYYHIKTVCVACNSIMGNNVDSPLVNHKLTELYRFAQSIAGKNGAVPNPFAGVFTEKELPNNKARLDVGEDGKLELYHHPTVDIKEENGQVVSIEISVDGKDTDKIDAMVEKILRRKDIPKEAVLRGERRIEISAGSFGSRWEIDTQRFKIGLLKIAYEYAVDTVPGYFEDEDAIRISQILMNAEYDAVLDYVKIGNGLQQEVCKPYEDFIDFDQKNHYLILVATDEWGLMCLVKLHDLFAVGIILSKKRYLSQGEIRIGVNSIEGRSFTKLTGEEMIESCLGPWSSMFAYYFDEVDAEQGKREVGNPSFRYEGQNNEAVPIYRRSGERLFYLKDLLEQSHVQMERRPGVMINVFEFDPRQEFFIRAVGSGKLYRVVGYWRSQSIIRKI
ncbi:HNH endonuclease [Pseudomonas cichorii]|uniref:HNH endonuclease n=1 Tax=Pseudomonas cichorii TaxID=36746 RepID=UPI0022A7E7D9|nr:HNH endonuclease [Pseudomonas cichorii]